MLHASILLALCLIGIALAIPHPHNGMISTSAVRNIDVTFSSPNYASEGTFLLMDKQTLRCMPFQSSVTIASVQVYVKNVACDFYTSGNCSIDTGEAPIFSVGCGDVQRVPDELAVKMYWSYRCAFELAREEEEGGAVRLMTTPRVSGEGTGM